MQFFTHFSLGRGLELMRPRHGWMVLVAILAGPIGLAQTSRGAETLPDAATVVERITSPATSATTKKTGLAEQVERLKAGATTMPASESADAWLRLMEQAFQEKTDWRHMQTGNEPSKIQQVFSAIPGPAAWGALVEQASQRAQKGGKEQAKWIAVRLLAHELRADNSAAIDDLHRMQEVVTPGAADSGGQYQLQQLAQAVLRQTDDPKLGLMLFREELHQASGMQSPWPVTVPDLATLGGPLKAKQLLREALQTKNAQLQFSGAEATEKLAKQLATEMINDLAGPQWGMVDSAAPESVALYEALAKRFGGPTTRKKPASRNWLSQLLHGSSQEEAPSYDDWEKQRAQGFYMAGLILQGRTDEAAALAERLGADQSTMPYMALSVLTQDAQAGRVFDFFDKLLSAHPELPYWDTYVQAAAAANRSSQALERVKQAAAKPNLPTEVRATLQQQLVNALLANDQVDQGIALLRKQLAGKMPTPGTAREQQPPTEAAAQLAKIGLVLGRGELVKEATDAMVKLCGDAAVANTMDIRQFIVTTAGLLHAAHRDEQAVTLLVQDLARPQKRDDSIMISSSGYSGPVEGELTALLSIYYQAGRYGDVLTMLKRIPLFEGDHLSDILTQSDAGMRPFEKSGQLYVGYMAASAEAKEGDRNLARRILQELLAKTGGYDPGYELLLELDGQQAIPFLDELYARDHFEERPLIWKAVLLLRAHKLDEAEKTIRKAIGVDPSDGEEPRGDRMRAYAVLANIRAAAGDAKQAAFFRGAVGAIRMSEDADRYIEAGLLKRGIDLYRQSLQQFADAYCIQSRLAVQLSEIGDTKAAAEHYERAFELMPESFGEVESHCFGCERIFDGKEAQSIAEGVFSKLLKSEPNNPQVHYLMGYLRDEQERYAEALPLFRRAVQLDPDYLNAWVKLDELGQQLHLPANDRDRITFALMRLDPLSHHSHPDFQKVTDLKGLWELCVKLGKEFPPQSPDPLMELTASAARRAAASKTAAEQTEQVRFSSAFSDRGQGEASFRGNPAKAVAQQQVISAVLQYLEQAQTMGFN